MKDKKVYNITMKKEYVEKIKKIAKENNLTISYILESIFTAYLQNLQNKTKHD